MFSPLDQFEIIPLYFLKFLSIKNLFSNLDGACFLGFFLFAVCMFWFNREPVVISKFYTCSFRFFAQIVRNMLVSTINLQAVCHKSLLSTFSESGFVTKKDLLELKKPENPTEANNINVQIISKAENVTIKSPFFPIVIRQNVVDENEYLERFNINKYKKEDCTLAEFNESKTTDLTVLSNVLEHTSSQNFGNVVMQPPVSTPSQTPMQNQVTGVSATENCENVDSDWLGWMFGLWQSVCKFFGIGG